MRSIRTIYTVTVILFLFLGTAEAKTYYYKKPKCNKEMTKCTYGVISTKAPSKSYYKRKNRQLKKENKTLKTENEKLKRELKRERADKKYRANEDRLESYTEAGQKYPR